MDDTVLPRSEPAASGAGAAIGSARPPFSTPAHDATIQAPTSQAPTSQTGNSSPNASTSAAAAAAASAAAGDGADVIELVTVPDGVYRIERELARGGIGKILVAHDRRLGRVVALKLLQQASANIARRFEREARITAMLQHPAIVPIYEAGRLPDGEPFYSMKLVSGRSFDQLIEDAKTLRDRLALLPHVLAVADALAYAHDRKVVHRDLKPSNVIVGGFGETVVIDWGLAKELESDPAHDELAEAEPAGEGAPRRGVSTSMSDGAALTVMGKVMGTPVYMPLEQAQGKPVDERADVYAIGAITYHVLSGQTPYMGETAMDILTQVVTAPPPPVSERVPDLAPDLAAIVEKAMARDAGARYPTAKGFADDLRKLLAGQLVDVHRYSPWTLLRRFVKRHRAAVGVACFGLLLLAAVGIWAVRGIAAGRDEATRERDAARQTTSVMLVERGRVYLETGRTQRAFAYLAEAFAQGDHSDGTRLLLGRVIPYMKYLHQTVEVADVASTKIAPDGKRALVLDAQAARVIDLETGSPGPSLPVAAAEHRTAWFGHSGQEVWIRHDQTLQLWLPDAGRVIATVPTTDEFWRIEATNDRKLVVLGDRLDDGKAVIRGIDAATGSERWRLAGDAFAIAGDGHVLVSQRQPPTSSGTRPDPSFQVVDEHTGQVMKTIELPTATVGLVDGANTVIGTSRAPDDGPAFVDALDLYKGDGQALVDRMTMGVVRNPWESSIWTLPGKRRVLTLERGDDERGRSFEISVWERGDTKSEPAQLTRRSSFVVKFGASSASRLSPPPIAIDETERFVATGQTDGTIQIRDLDSGSVLATFEAHAGEVTAVKFGAGRRLMTAGIDHKLRVWDLPAMEPDPDLRTGADTVSGIARVAVSNDGRRVAIPNPKFSFAVDVIDAATHRLVRRLPVPANIDNVALDETGSRLVVGTIGGVLAFDVESGAPLTASCFSGLSTSGTTVSVSADGRHIVAYRKGVAALCDVGKDVVRTIKDEPHTSGAPQVQISPDGRRALVATLTARLLDLDAKRELVSAPLASQTAADLSADGKVAAWLAKDGLQIVDAATGRVLARTHIADARWLALSPDGSRVVVGGDGAARILDTRTGALIAIIDHSASPLTQAGVGHARVKYATGGSLLVGLGEGADAEVWDAQSGRELLTLLHGVDELETNHGTRVVTVGSDDVRWFDLVRASDADVTAARASAFWEVSDGRLVPRKR